LSDAEHLLVQRFKVSREVLAIVDEVLRWVAIVHSFTSIPVRTFGKQYLRHTINHARTTVAAGRHPFKNGRPPSLGIDREAELAQTVRDRIVANDPMSIDELHSTVRHF
jgi:hypothetical protein